jgi:ketosteroid isomerase-like protein
MSQANVEIVRAVFEAVNRGDLDAARKHAAPDCVFDQSRAIGVERGIYNVEQFLAVTQDFRNTWKSVRWEVAEYIDTGEHVVTPATNHLRRRDGSKCRPASLGCGRFATDWFSE